MNDEQQSGRARSRGGNPPPARLHAVDWVIETGAERDVLCELDRRLRLRRRRRMWATAGVLVVAVAGIVWQRPDSAKSRHERPVDSSVVLSVPRRESLSDGTVVELKDGAEIEVAFTPSLRRVLLVRGVAHFQVAKMAAPFVVAAGGVEVRAVGTAFSVQLGGAQTEIVVTEGRVAVEHRAGTTEGRPKVGGPPPNDDKRFYPGLVAGPSTLLVEAGNRVVVPTASSEAPRASPQVVPVDAAELAARFEWRSPRLEFSRTPLAEALAMMNRHAPAGLKVEVLLADPSLGRVEISGMLRADNIETLLRLLEEEHGFRVEYRGPREVLVQRGP